MGCPVYKRLMILVIRIPSPLDDLDFVEIKSRAEIFGTEKIQNTEKQNPCRVKISILLYCIMFYFYFSYLSSVL